MIDNAIPEEDSLDCPLVKIIDKTRAVWVDPEEVAMIADIPQVKRCIIGFRQGGKIEIDGHTAAEVINLLWPEGGE